MGVHGLWELLSPVGRRVSVETLAGKKLAIDASIWMIQFMKAMRDEKGEMVRNAHILGFFRRICKLLFLRTKPVFVFDGATPALKRRTVIARRRQRENAQTKIRKTAEKLLLNHLKSMRLKELATELENQRRNKDAKGKKVITDHPEDSNLRGDDNISRRYNQEALDEMLAASIAADEDGSLIGNTSTSGAEIPIEEEEDGDEDEEMMLPTMHGKVDPAVLAALPPSMQLDLLVQMRERLMAENRQKYQKVKQAPSKFSELQIQSYLKTVAFRREIDEVQRSAAGRGVGGVQTSRIASEANREFIFSSSFTGDRQVLTSAGVKRNVDEQHQTPADHPSSDLPESIASTNRPNAATGPSVEEPRREFHDDLETYLDERGRVRVSRVRAMGIRMTRDLQRNLDLMKEIEREKTSANKIATENLVPNKNMNGLPRKSPSKSQFPETSGADNVPFNLNVRNEESISENGTSIVVSLEDDGEHKYSDGDDELFARLVAGDTVVVSSADNTPSKKHYSDSASDCDWEEGVIEEKSDCLTHNDKVENKSSPAEGGVDDERDVEWEEVSFDVPNHTSPCPAEYMETASKGVLEEEAELQEAIRRSLGDTRGLKSLDVSSEVEKSNEPIEMAHDDTCTSPLYQENDRIEADMPLRNIQQTIGPSCEIVAGVEKLINLGDISVSNLSSGRQSAPSVSVHCDKVNFLVDKPSESGDSHGDIGHMDQITVGKKEGVHLVVEQHLDTSIGGVLTTTCAGVSPRVSGLVVGEISDVMLADVHENDSEMVVNDQSNETKEHEESFVKESGTNIDSAEKLSEEKNHGDFLVERDDNVVDKFAFKDNREPFEVTKASLEEEILVLGKERIDLGEEQRKLERNLESASSEMFAECQELLQMFGLPYIIAPMEAEAQCAYMELENIVDGVVTDDSDAFLFGARSVYKNIFDERKYVETYLMKDIENELGLTREQLIRMALLLGSDYTEGVSGIGIVNAVEVVNAFPEENGLRKFREWIESPDPSILGQFDVQTGSSSRKRGSKVGNNDTSCSDSNVEGLTTADQNVSPSVELIENMKQIFMDKHRNVSKNWHIPSTFPSEAVISAYASPKVDKSTEPFSWGKPDLFVLRKLCWEKFGWGSQKADELLLPVLKEYNKHETQLRLEAFYTFNERFAKIRSKRIKKAVKGITGKKSLELMDDSVQEGSESRKKRRVSPTEPVDGKPRNPLCGTENGITGDESNSVEKSTAKRSRNTTNKGSSARGRGRGKGRSPAVGRGKQKENYGREFDEASSSDENSSDSLQEAEVQKKGLQETRRSTRLRKAVKYTENDLEVAEPAKSDQDDKKWTDEEAVEEEPFSDGGLLGDAAVGPSSKNIHKVGDPSLGGLREEYLAVGGGFCTDEAEHETEHETETCQLGSNQGGDSFLAESHEDDLKMGGGFCLDEVEIGEDPHKWTSSEARATISENAESSYCSGLASDGFRNGGRSDAFESEQNLDGSNATISNHHLKVDMPAENVKENDSGTTSERSLSAMPYLRRKRRKT